MAALLVLISIGLVAAFYERRNKSTEQAKPEVAEDPAVKLRLEESMKLRREEVVRRVESLLRNPPQPDRKSPHEVTAQKEELKSPSLEAFEVLSDDRVVDLRAWRQLPANDPTAEAFVIFNNRRVLLKVKPAETYATQFSTSGRDLHLRAINPNPDFAYVLASEGVVGGQVMKVRQVVMDVSNVDLQREFTAQTMATFCDSLQKPDELWLGLNGYHGSLRSSMLLLFPKDRPFKDFTLRVAPTSNSPPVPYTDPVITFKGENNSWIYWEVGATKDKYVYRIDWTW
jgi:hypothetical protein